MVATNQIKGPTGKARRLAVTGLLGWENFPPLSSSGLLPCFPKELITVPSVKVSAWGVLGGAVHPCCC